MVVDGGVRIRPNKRVGRSGEQVLEALRRVPEVKEAHMVYGLYDILTTGRDRDHSGAQGCHRL